MRVGLFGGSFDPAHKGHAHVAHEALKRLKLDQIWWLVSPQNPLKPQSAPLAERLKGTQSVARSRRMVVTDIENRWNLRYTADVLKALQHAYPGVRFVWIMGADNLLNFGRWRRWNDIVRAIPIAIVSRPTAGPDARAAKPFHRYAAARVNACAALATKPAPAWAFIPARFDPTSSTSLRARNVARRIG